MKKLLCLIFILICIDLQATLTRVQSLGDVEDPVTGRISGLIKDDINDIYLNPACVNDVKAFLILTSFHLDYGRDDDHEKADVLDIKDAGVKDSREVSESDISCYDFKLNTGILIPLKVFNLFINYQPNWDHYSRKTTTRISYDDGSGETNQTTLSKHNAYEDTQLPIDITLGLNMADRMLLGLRTGYYNTKYDETVETDDEIIRKGEFTSDRLILGAGIKFNFSEKISISFAIDADYFKKDESPISIADTLGGGDNWDPVKKAYNYSATENATSYDFKLLPEIQLKDEKFIRTLIGVEIINHKKDFNFSERSFLKDYKVSDYDQTQLIGNFGGSFNHNLGDHTKAVYGLRYHTILDSMAKYKIYPNENNKENYTEHQEELNDHYIGVFTGFDIEITKYIYVRSGLSQGLYRYQLSTVIDTDAAADSKVEVKDKYQYILPETVFTLGFYIQPITDLILEFNFTGSKDWNMQNIKNNSTTTRIDDELNKEEKYKDYDFSIGMGIQYKI